MPSMISSTVQPIASASSRGVGERPSDWVSSALARADLHPQLLEPARHPDRPALVAEVALDLADDRRGRVRRELDAAVGVEAVDRLDQADRADLDEVLDRLAAVAEPARAVLDQRQVQVDQRRRGRSARAAVGVVGVAKSDEQLGAALPGRARRRSALRDRPRRPPGRCDHVRLSDPPSEFIVKRTVNRRRAGSAALGGQRGQHLPGEAVVLGRRRRRGRHGTVTVSRPGRCRSGRPGRSPRRPRGAPCALASPTAMRRSSMSSMGKSRRAARPAVVVRSTDT